MAPVSAVDFDLQSLSTNWKKLQEELNAGAPKAPKRIAATLQSAQHNNERQRNNKNPRLPPRTPATGKSGIGLSWSASETAPRPSTSLTQWAEENDISAKDLHTAYGASAEGSFQASGEIVNEGMSACASSSSGKYVAIDCEMVGVGPTPNSDSALARVSVVNYLGHQLYDSFVKTKEPVTDFRTEISGITPALLLKGRTLEVVQHDVGQLLDGKVLVGHSVRHDLDAMMLSHPRRDVRDTSRHPAFRALSAGKTPGLKKLAKEILGLDIQGGRHSSIEDARATMLLFRRDKEGFDREHLSKWGPDRRTHEKGGSKGQQRNREKKRKKKRKTKR